MGKKSFLLVEALVWPVLEQLLVKERIKYALCDHSIDSFAFTDADLCTRIMPTFMVCMLRLNKRDNIVTQNSGGPVSFNYPTAKTCLLLCNLLMVQKCIVTAAQHVLSITDQPSLPVVKLCAT